MFWTTLYGLFSSELLDVIFLTFDKFNYNFSLTIGF